MGGPGRCGVWGRASLCFPRHGSLLAPVLGPWGLSVLSRASRSGRWEEGMSTTRRFRLSLAALGHSSVTGDPGGRGRLGSRVCHTRETGAPGSMVTPAPGPLRRDSGPGVSRAPGAELLPWKGNPHGLV